MTSFRLTIQISLLVLVACVAVAAQTGTDKQFAKDGLIFDYPRVGHCKTIATATLSS
jgi:hypothetical protein